MVAAVKRPGHIVAPSGRASPRRIEMSGYRELSGV